MNAFKISLTLLAAFALSKAPALASPQITVTCKTYDFDTQVQQTSFHPGDKVQIVVTPSYPGTISQTRQLTLVANATATIAGISLPYTINPFISKLPNTNPKTNTALFTSGESQNAIIKIPRHMPTGSTFTVFLTATVPGFVPGHCNVVLHVVAAPPP